MNFLLRLLTGGVLKSLTSFIIDPILRVVESFHRKEISKAELEAKVQGILVDGLARVEVAHADSLSKTYESFWSRATQNPVIIRMWALVVSTQLFVLVWHQFGIPFIVFMGWTNSYPSSGTTVEWAYLLLGFLFGAGALMLRAGPGQSGVVENLKALVGRK